MQNTSESTIQQRLMMLGLIETMSAEDKKSYKKLYASIKASMAKYPKLICTLALSILALEEQERLEAEERAAKNIGKN